MNIKQVTVGYSRLVTGVNFTNKRYSCEMTADLIDGDHWEKAREDLMIKCEEYVESRLRKEEVAVVSKDQAEKIKELIKSVNSIKTDELPF